MENTKELYKNRFDPEEIKRKNEIWKVLCEDFFSKFINKDESVLDLAAGYCEFINNINCGEKFAVDLNEDTKDFANPNVKVFNTSSTELSVVPEASIDIVFVSNFFEHLKTREDLLLTLEEIFKILKPGGKILVLQPNFRFTYKNYWDFFDHYLPLTDKSLTEALRIAGFKIEKVIDQFLPFTTKSGIPQHPLLVKLYLHFPPIWKVMGGQAFVVAVK